MKINSLTISNFRGISGELEIDPGAENVVIVGPNGSGKSSVIAAIDFLFTGSVRELSGDGTQSLTENRHAPHIDADPSDAWVEAEFLASGDYVTVRRSVDDRMNPVIGSEDTNDQRGFETAFNSVASAADRDLHLLSREEILDFITANAGTRSESIRSLLDLQHIQDRRLALNNAAEHFEDEASRLEREAYSQREGVYSALDSDIDSAPSLVGLINEFRETLGGDEIADLHESFLNGIDSPSQRVIASPLLRSDGRQRIQEFQAWFETGAEEFLEAAEEYHAQQRRLDSDDDALKDLERQELVNLGKEAIDKEAERCPLCLENWDPDELEDLLSDRAEQAEELQEELEALEEQQDSAQQLLTNIRIIAESIRETLVDVDRFDSDLLEQFINTIQEWEEEYDDSPLSTPSHEELTPDERIDLLQPSDLESMLRDIEEHLAEGPVLDELEEVWQKLEISNRRYEEMLSYSRRAAEHRQVASDMRALHHEFITARDTALTRIYDEIEERFESYYTSIHGDESEFAVGLDPSETGLNMEVDFHSRGQHPPHALHSEGHQDSMGICLYFALFDWLQNQEQISIMMLDDVVMSIDAEHRRPLAKLMATEVAKDNQLFIATHDDLWHRHLRSSGVVTSSNAIQFSGWDIDEGPRVIDRPEMEWETIEAELEAGNVSIAAHQTRRMAEWFLREACDGLNAKVPFKADSQWTLGDFQQGVVPRYKSLARSAKDTAHSWGREERVEHFEELNDEMIDINNRISQDGAALNPNVHWNETESEFAHCTPAELEPAVEAYKDLHETLWCDECDSPLTVASQGQTDVSVRCNCASVYWNLSDGS